MAKYDPDRIAALAAGSLDPDEAAAFEAEISADPRAAAELAAQRLALEALRRAPAPVLSAAERTELRRAVAAALNLEAAPRPAAAVVRRRLPWKPLAVAAVSLAALVAAVPLFGLLSVGSDGDTALTSAAREATTEAGDAVFATAGTEDGEQNVASEGTQSPAGILGGEAPTTRERAPADKAVADLAADPAPLFLAEGDEDLPCLEEARILLRADDPAGARLAAESGELVVWFLSSDGVTLDGMVALHPATCEFLAAYP